jgi:hypothetical protein
MQNVHVDVPLASVYTHNFASNSLSDSPSNFMQIGGTFDYPSNMKIKCLLTNTICHQTPNFETCTTKLNMVHDFVIGVISVKWEIG